MIEQIKTALKTAGLPDTPNSQLAALSDYGLDSLIIIMAVIEFEKTFNIKIPAKDFHSEHFATLQTLEQFLKNQGAK